MQDYEIVLPNGCSPFDLLAAAIVHQAAHDWYELKGKKNMLRYGSAAWERVRCEQYILEQWFLSDWCATLTYGNGELLLEKLKGGTWV